MERDSPQCGRMLVATDSIAVLVITYRRRSLPEQKSWVMRITWKKQRKMKLVESNLFAKMTLTGE